MDNSILITVASINATILSILCAVLIGFYLYSYPVLFQIREKLNDLRYETAQIIKPSVYIEYKDGAFDPSEYLGDDGLLDFSRIQKELFFLASGEIPEFMLKLPVKGQNLSSSDLNKKVSIVRLINIVCMLRVSYPYTKMSNTDKQSLKSDEESQRIEYNDKWRDDLLKWNDYLSFFWKGRENEVLRSIHNEKEIIDPKKSPDEGIGSKFNKNLFFERLVKDFFERVMLIQNNIIPQIRELSYKLNLLQEKFQIKMYLSVGLGISFIMLICYTFFPLFIHLIWKPPYIKAIELLFISTFCLVYGSIILFFLKQALQMTYK